ncbi:MAG: hypothetical protein ACQEUZ_06435 [Pseudomonadota bacterium]
MADRTEDVIYLGEGIWWQVSDRTRKSLWWKNFRAMLAAAPKQEEDDG